MLNIARGLKLPLEAITQTFGILAVRGAGKTYTGAVIAEEMIATGMPVVIADPIGVWWGLRSEFPVVIFGGDHGDVPLEAGAGEFIAKWVVTNRQSCVLDMSLFRKGEQIRFMTAFCETLYRLNREPLHVILDEADTFAPQRPMRDQARMLGALEDLVKKGRARGLGVTMITQRAAVLNKNVLTQIEALFCLRTTSPQDRKAVEGWIEANASEEDRKEFLADLPSLPIGTAWFWSPGWLKMFKRVQIRKRKSFDSSATPKVGKKLAVPKRMAKVALSELQDQMQETIERANEDNPRVLRSRIAKLKAEAQKLAKDVERTKDSALPKEVPVLKDKQIDKLTDVAESMHGTARVLALQATQLNSAADDILKALAKAVIGSSVRTQPKKAPKQRTPIEVLYGDKAKNFKPGHPPSNGEVKLSAGQKKILLVLAHHPDGKKKTAVALMAGYSHKGGGFNNYLSSLRSQGLIDGRGDIQITEEGLAALGPVTPLPSGAELLSYWKGQLGKASRSILEVLYEAYPNSLTKEEVAERTEYSSAGGGFNNALGKLRTLELIEGRGAMRAGEVFFE